MFSPQKGHGQIVEKCWEDVSQSNGSRTFSVFIWWLSDIRVGQISLHQFQLPWSGILNLHIESTTIYLNRTHDFIMTLSPAILQSRINNRIGDQPLEDKLRERRASETLKMPMFKSWDSQLKAAVVAKHHTGQNWSLTTGDLNISKGFNIDGYSVSQYSMTQVGIEEASCQAIGRCAAFLQGTMFNLTTGVISGQQIILGGSLSMPLQNFRNGEWHGAMTSKHIKTRYATSCHILGSCLIECLLSIWLMGLWHMPGNEDFRGRLGAVSSSPGVSSSR